MEDNKKDLTSLGRYLNLLKEAIKLRDNIPNKINNEMCNRYYKLYSDEHVRLFGCKPDSSLIQNVQNTQNNQNTQSNQNTQTFQPTEPGDYNQKL